MTGYAEYKDNSVLTQPPGKLVVMLYDGAIRFLQRAAAALEAGDHPAKAEYLNKAQAVINELSNSLDLEAGGEIAANLRALYEWMSRHLTAAVVRKDPQAIRDVIACLTDLNEGWKAVAT